MENSEKQSGKLFKELFDFATKNDLIVQNETGSVNDVR